MRGVHGFEHGAAQYNQKNIAHAWEQMEGKMMTRSVARGGKGKGYGIEGMRLAMIEAARNGTSDNRQKEYREGIRTAIIRAKNGEFMTAQKCTCHHSAKWIGGEFMHLSRGVLNRQCAKCRCNNPKPYSEKGRWASQ